MYDAKYGIKMIELFEDCLCVCRAEFLFHEVGVDAGDEVKECC